MTTSLTDDFPLSFALDLLRIFEVNPSMFGMQYHCLDMSLVSSLVGRHLEVNGLLEDRKCIATNAHLRYEWHIAIVFLSFTSDSREM